MKYCKQFGFAQIFVLAGMLLVSAALPVATKLVQQNQENRSNAAAACSSYNNKPSACSSAGCSYETLTKSCSPRSTAKIKTTTITKNKTTTTKTSTSTKTCTSFTYTDWTPTSCPSSGRQTRIVKTSSPAGCTGGTRVTSRNCSPPTPTRSATKTTCSYICTKWGSCSSGWQTCTTDSKLSTSQPNCIGGRKIGTRQKCTPANSSSNTATKKADGSTCSYNSECTSGYCNLTIKKCATKVRTTSTEKTTSTTKDCVCSTTAGKCDLGNPAWKDQNGTSGSYAWSCSGSNCNPKNCSIKKTTDATKTFYLYDGSKCTPTTSLSICQTTTCFSSLAACQLGNNKLTYYYYSDTCKSAGSYISQSACQTDHGGVTCYSSLKNCQSANPEKNDNSYGCETKVNLGNKMCKDNKTVNSCQDVGDGYDWRFLKSCNDNEICTNGGCLSLLVEDDDIVCSSSTCVKCDSTNCGKGNNCLWGYNGSSSLRCYSKSEAIPTPTKIKKSCKANGGKCVNSAYVCVNNKKGTVIDETDCASPNYLCCKPNSIETPCVFDGKLWKNNAAVCINNISYICKLGSLVKVEDCENRGCTIDGTCNKTDDRLKLLANGSKCGKNNDCFSGHCINSICLEQEPPAPFMNGSKCGSFLECFSGHCIYGVCSEKLANGGKCERWSDCSSNHCIYGVCSNLLPNLSRCQSDYDCSSRLCIYDFCSNKLADGSRCRYYSDCSSERCINNVCSKKLAKGAKCDWNEDCSSGLCLNNLCSLLSNGSHCNVDDDCYSGRCDYTSGGRVCLDRLANGGKCERNNDCKSSRCINNVCSDLLLNGMKCKYNNDCVSEHCINGVCSNLLSNGLKCIYNEDCQSGHCINDRCLNPFANGSKCDWGTDCSSGHCINNICSNLLNNRSKCDWDEDCSSGHCINDVCSDQLVDGSKCRYYGDCSSGYCINGVCSEPLLANGSKCEKDGNCTSGYCIFNRCSATKLSNGSKCEYDKDCVSGKCVNSICSINK